MKSLKDIEMPRKLSESISSMLKSGRLPHAVLLEGASEKTRDELALFLAACFTCSGGSKPCFSCQDCIKASKNNHPDIITVDPGAANEKTFKVAVVRDIRRDAFVSPNEASVKVYILKSADKMNNQAQNALLKIIEEPPAHVRFILECESKAFMLKTILSRVTAFNLGAAEYTLSDEKERAADELADNLARAIMSSSELEFMKLTAKFEKDKDLFPLCLSALQLIFRDAVIISTGGVTALSPHAQTGRELASKFSLKVLVDLVESCNHFSSCIKSNANKNLLITRFCSVIRKTAYKG